MKEEKPSFKKERSDFDGIDDQLIDEFDLKANPKTIKHTGGKPAAGACGAGECNIF